MHPNPFFLLLLQEKFWDSKLGTYPAPGQSLRQLKLGTVVTLGQWRASSYLQKRPLRSCFEVMGVRPLVARVLRAYRKEPALASPAKVSLQGRPEDAGGCWRMPLSGGLASLRLF